MIEGTSYTGTLDLDLWWLDDASVITIIMKMIASLKTNFIKYIFELIKIILFIKDLLLTIIIYFFEFLG